MSMMRLGKYVWLACGAGWTVIYLVTQLDIAMLGMIGSLAVAGLFQIVEEIGL